MARVQPAAKLLLHDMTVNTRLSVVSHVRIATRVDEGVGTNTYRHTNCNTQNYSGRKPWLHLCVLLLMCGLLFRVALDTLEHRDVSQIDRVSKRLVPLVASLAFAIGQ